MALTTECEYPSQPDPGANKIARRAVPRQENAQDRFDLACRLAEEAISLIPDQRERERLTHELDAEVR